MYQHFIEQHLFLRDAVQEVQEGNADKDDIVIDGPSPGGIDGDDKNEVDEVNVFGLPIDVCVELEFVEYVGNETIVDNESVNDFDVSVVHPFVRKWKLPPLSTFYI